jgi:hypothetical protein
MATRNTKKFNLQRRSSSNDMLAFFIVRSQLSVMWKLRQRWPNLQLPLLVRSRPSPQSTSCVVLSNFGITFHIGHRDRSVRHQPTRTIIVPWTRACPERFSKHALPTRSKGVRSGSCHVALVQALRCPSILKLVDSSDNFSPRSNKHLCMRPFTLIRI